MTDLQQLPYTLTPMTPDALPPRYEQRVSRYLEIVQAFLASGHAAVRLDIAWPPDITNGQQESFANGLRGHATRHHLTVHVFRRRGHIYLVRGDLEDWKP
jgi:hypothetical protein